MPKFFKIIKVKVKVKVKYTLVRVVNATLRPLYPRGKIRYPLFF